MSRGMSKKVEVEMTLGPSIVRDRGRELQMRLCVAAHLQWVVLGEELDHWWVVRSAY